MDNTTATILAGQTKKYNIPLGHFEHEYIQKCTDGKELERIYKELKGGELGSFPALEELTLNRLREIKPNSQVLRIDKAPLDKSALSNDELKEFDVFLEQMKTVNKNSSIASDNHENNDVDSIPIRSKSTIKEKNNTSVPVIKRNGKTKRIVPRSYDEWGKLDKQLGQESNSDDEDDKDIDGKQDNNETTNNELRPLNPLQDPEQRMKIAEQHRLDGNSAFKSNNYQKSIDYYTKSIQLDSANLTTYMNRAIAHYKLNNYDASIADCSHILSKDSNHIKALFRRASCYVAQQDYEKARDDIDILLTQDQGNVEAQNLLKTIPVVQKPKGVRIPITEDDGEDNDDQSNNNPEPSPLVPVKIPIVEVDEEEEEIMQEQQEATTEELQPMNTDIPTQSSNIHSRPCIDSEEISSTTFDNHFQNCDDITEFQENIFSHLSTVDDHTAAENRNNDNDDVDEDDDMVLGDEANPGFTGNISDDDARASHSLNVSPTMDDDDVPELIDHKQYQTPPLTPPKQQHSIISSARDDHTTISISRELQHSVVQNDDYDDLYDKSISTRANEYSSYHQPSISPSSFDVDDDQNGSNYKQTSSIASAYDDQIAKSDFGPTIQSWLRDLAALRSNSNPTTSREQMPWSKVPRPSKINNIHRDIQRYYGMNDCINAIEASKKMLKNGVLDYHYHAEYIASALVTCANCYLKSNDNVRAIQFTSEALQYKRTDTDALICRAKAFENEKCLLFSYADYVRIPSKDYSYGLAQRACEKLADELSIAEGESWREKLPQDTNDDERYFTYIKTKDESSKKDLYEWYRERSNQLYLDACFVLAIRCYTYCIELKPDVAFLYSNRAACYLKVFEPQKALENCDIAIRLDPTNIRALYRKACAYKMSYNNQQYESIMKKLIELQPHNQTLLAEYFGSRHESIPRNLRRLRTNQADKTTTVQSSSMKATNPEVKTSNVTMNTQEIYLSYDELEQIRTQKLLPFSSNAGYVFQQQLNLLKSDDVRGQCAFVLRLPTQNLFKLTHSATPKLIEIIIHASRIMVDAEKRYKQEHKSSVLQFSYLQFCFNVLIELTTLNRLDSALSMIDQSHRTYLDDLLSYYSSISSALVDFHKLDRLRKQN